jgi:hypothetical protein
MRYAYSGHLKTQNKDSSKATCPRNYEKGSTHTMPVLLGEFPSLSLVVIVDLFFGLNGMTDGICLHSIVI